MDPGPPPPPPPHGENPRTTAGAHPKYEIFMIPEHSAGAGFLYLPSLKPNINSFVAGFASALMCVVVVQSLKPAIQQWWAEFQGMGNMGMMMLVVAVGMGAWAMGRQQADSTSGGGGGDGTPGNERRRAPFTSTGAGSFGAGGGPGAYSSTPPPPPPRGGPPPHSGGPPPNQHAPPPPQRPHDANPPPNNHHQQPPPRPPEPDPQRSSWQAPPRQEPPKTETPKNAWEKAREETRKREEERKAREADQKRREDAARRLRELREKEARERELREKDRKEREQREKEAKEREAKEKERLLNETRIREQREKELRDRLERERVLREKMEREAKEAKEKLEQARLDREAKQKEEAANKAARTGSTYAYSSVGERTSMWPNGRPPASSPSHPSANPSATPKTPSATVPRAPPSASAASTSTSPTKKQPPPSATGTHQQEDPYSYRPYDKPKRPAHAKSVSDFSETSWAPSQSTARTTPPPSMRSPYTTKDPDKIVIRAVYCFLNQFAKTPASQLISGLGTVTDGLILRITTEGLFIDDDVRGVPQREWDVKAWTLKLVEVWCPTHSQSASSTSNPTPQSGAHPFFKTIPTSRKPDRSGAPKTLTGDEADAFLVDMLGACKGQCRLGESPFTRAAARDAGPSSSVSGYSSNSHHKTGDWKAKGLHLLRATVRDQEGKRYLFVLSEEESWKVAVGLQRLRRGTQVRALGVSGMTQLEVKNMLETLGW
ncbi:hypothetical protein GE09DRAFT_574603 [Coniochaeta sp. 2T2.1]|nr:hypothetical protein GE09DRAFT_574603 [Coniochaeta sp. 2T2.1]